MRGESIEVLLITELPLGPFGKCLGGLEACGSVKTLVKAGLPSDVSRDRRSRRGVPAGLWVKSFCPADYVR